MNENHRENNKDKQGSWAVSKRRNNIVHSTMVESLTTCRAGIYNIPVCIYYKYIRVAELRAYLIK